MSLIDFTPKSGPVGSAVILYGTAFSATPASNTVKFNGTTATVTFASTTQLVVTVPTGATTGAVSVTVGAGTVTSSVPFTVTTTGTTGAPTIRSFTPTSGASGTAVTISGANYDPIAASDRVRVNTTQATVTTASAASLTANVPLGATSGKISVGTTRGTATSSADFTVPLSSFTAADVASTTRAAFGQATTVPVSTANKIVLVLFEGIGGHRLSMNVSGVTFSSVTLSINTPTGATLKTVTSGTSDAFMESTTLPMTGDVHDCCRSCGYSHW